MRNFKCSIADMRKQVFAEVARLAYEGGDYRRMEKLPYKIVPGEVGNQRESIFLESLSTSHVLPDFRCAES